MKVDAEHGAEAKDTELDSDAAVPVPRKSDDRHKKALKMFYWMLGRS